MSEQPENDTGDSFSSLIIGKQELDPTVTLVTFSHERPLSFEAGQHLLFEIPTQNGVVERAFSIASPPGAPTQILVKRVPQGAASVFFASAPVGTTLTTYGPRGTFTLHSPGPSCFLASGSGISPFRSMITDRTKKTVERTTLF
jgi:ferredoxin-NADP reductase